MSALFADVLGEAAFSTLPQSVQMLHLAEATRRYRGEAQVLRGRGLLSRLCAWAASLPQAGSRVSLVVEIQKTPTGERWTRDFAGRTMCSILWAEDHFLCERLGLLKFRFALTVENAAMVWRVRHANALGLRLPTRWFAGVVARESESDGRYCFDVQASLPLAGLLVHYWGWLDVD